MSRFGLASLCVALVLARSLDADACACSGASGTERAMTSRSERWALSLTETARWVHGFWDQEGNYLRAGSGFQGQLDFSLAAAYRLARRFELSGSLAYGKTTVTAPGFSAERSGFGDSTLTLRWEMLDEPMPHARSLWRPAMAWLGSIRAPTGNTARSDASSSGRIVGGGSDVSSQSLGTWEIALALEAIHSPSERWHMIALAEGAWRAPDDSLRIDRQLGPRLLGQIAVSHDIEPDVSLGLLTDLAWEGDVELDGERRSGTGQRLWNIGAVANVTLAESGLHTTTTLRYAPPISGVGVNAIGTTVFGVSIGYAR